MTIAVLTGDMGRHGVPGDFRVDWEKAAVGQRGVEFYSLQVRESP